MKQVFPINDKIVLYPRNLDTQKHNLHKTLAKIFLLAEFFGYLPAQGITGPSYHSIQFTWKSWRVLYAILTIFGAVFLTSMQINKILSSGIDLLEADRLCFNVSGVISGILLINFARSWPKLIKDWNDVEVAMVSYGWPPGLEKKLNILFYTFTVLALVEFILNQSNKLVLALNCKDTTEDALIYFLSNMSYSNTFSVLDYNFVGGIFLQIINLQLTFCWTFPDLFVMCLSTALAYRFKQIRTRIRSLSLAKISSELIWKNVREDYNRLCKLCRRVDEEISHIVLVAFAVDLFFILVQLFNSLRTMRNDLERVYFYFSFGFLILRTISLCLFGAKVNDESKSPMIALNGVPSVIYNLEIQRFIHQVGISEVAITGRNFFSITRGLILSIAGAIVTYELVLIQFNDELLKEITLEDKKCPIFL